MVTAQDGSSSIYKIVVTRVKSADATLNALTAVGIIQASDPVDIAISPDFDPTTNNYSTRVTARISAVNITPALAGPNATVKINNTKIDPGMATANLPLVFGDNIFNVEITAEDGTVNTYVLTITRLHSTDAQLSNLVLNGADLSPAFNAEGNNYTASVNDGMANISLTPTTKNSHASVTVNNVTLASGTSSGDIALNPGDNLITVLVTAADGTTTNTYTVTVTRLASSDATLSNLTAAGISSSAGPVDISFSPGFSPAVDGYTAAVPARNSAINITATTNEPNATVAINNTVVPSGSQTANMPLNFGDNTFSIAVTAQDGTVNTYTLNVTRLPSTDAKLSGLVLNGTNLSPVFDASTNNYAASVGSNVASINLTPITKNSHASVVVNDAVVASGNPSDDITLNYGDNPIAIVVTAADGITTNTYTLTVTRAKSSDATLNSLTAQGVTISGDPIDVTLTPDFDPATNSYTTAVAARTSAVNLTAIVNEPNATIAINDAAIPSGSPTDNLSLNFGVNTFNIVITAQDGTINTYTLTITRLPSTDAKLSNLVLNIADLAPAFDAATNNYTASVASDVSTINLTPTTKNSHASVTVNDATVVSGSPSNDITLNYGDNNINVVVTAADGTTINTYSITVNRALSSDATLSNLFVSGAELSPTFDAATYAYTTSVSAGISSTTVNATVNEPNATITINDAAVVSGESSGDINLNPGENTIHVVVTAQDGTTNNYTIVVNRALSSDATLSNLFVSGAVLSPAFDPANNAYTTSVTNGVTSTTINATVNDAGATIAINDAVVNSEESSADIPLNYGDNTVNVNVTAADGTVNTYTIIINRAYSSDATLSSLSLNGADLLPGFDPSTTDYTASVINDISSVAVTPSANDGNATVTVNDVTVEYGGTSDAIPLEIGDNHITVTVTAQDGTTNTYNITVTRAGSSDATLSSLSLNGGDLSPEFDPSTTAYTASVTNDVSSVSITPSVNDENATVTVNDATVGSGETSDDIPLTVGDNNINVTVTAQDGTTNSYTITVTRAGSSDATLSNLYLSSGALSPEFDPSTTDYSASVTNDVSSVTITPSATDENATVTIKDATVAPGETSADIPLEVGDNYITVNVTAQDGTTNAYNLTVTRQPMADATLSSLVLSAGNLSPEFEEDSTNYHISVGKSVTSTTVTPTANDENARIYVNESFIGSGEESEAIPLDYGDNIINISVTSADDARNINYTVTVTRARPLDASLANLTISSGQLSPSFASDVTGYNVLVANSVSTVTLTPTTNGKTSVTVGGKTVKSGQASAAMTLAVGKNKITVVGKATDGTTKTYTVTVTRDVAVTNNPNLASLSLSNIKYSPVFSSGTTSYNASVDNAIASTVLTYASSDAGSKVTVNGTLYTGTSGAIPLNVGANTITIVVTAKDGKTKKTYTITVTRAKAAQTIAFEVVGKTFGDADFSPAYASSKLPLTYTSSDPKIATIVSGKVHIVAVGAVTITASQAGNDAYLAANNVSQKITIGKGTQIISFAATTKTFGDADFSPATASSGLALTYTSSDPKIATIVNGKVHIVAAGTVTITAAQAGNAGYNAAVNASQKITISKAVQTITLAAIKKSFGDADFSPATASSGLAIAYTSSNTKVATIVSGKVHIVAIGTATITANQAGNANYSAAKSVSQKLTVVIGAQTITFAAQTKNYGDADFSPATVSSGLPITYKTSDTKIATIVSGKVHIVAVGVVTITASQAGKTNQFTAAKTVSQKITIKKAVQTFQFASGVKTYGDADYSPATASSGLPVSYSSSNTKVVTVVSGKLHIVAAGFVVITANQAGNDKYAAATTATQQLSIAKATLTITADNKTKKVGTANPVLTASIKGFVNGDDSKGLSTQPKLTTTAVTGSKVGTYPITVTGAASSNYAFIYVAGKLTVAKTVVKEVEPETIDTIAKPATEIPAIVKEIPATAKPSFAPPVVGQAVSPNGDGINDVLNIEGINNFPDNKLTIIDKNGAGVTLIQGYDNVDKVFDGHAANGMLLKPGTYYYLLAYKDNGTTKRLTGFVIIKY